jgi:hypothetical protein
MSSPQTPPPTPRRGSRRSWPFFLVLTILAVTGSVLPALYNLNQQLRPEAYEMARSRWEENGPHDYDLEYTVAYNRDPVPERNVVLVRDRRVLFAERDGEVIALDRAFGALLGPLVGVPWAEPGQPPLLVEGIFERIAAVLRTQPAERRNDLVVAVFDPRDGHPRRFLYRKSGTDTREEWIVRLYPPGELGKESPRDR